MPRVLPQWDKRISAEVRERILADPRGGCTCPAAEFHPEGACKHQEGLRKRLKYGKEKSIIKIRRDKTEWRFEKHPSKQVRHLKDGIVVPTAGKPTKKDPAPVYWTTVGDEKQPAPSE